MEKESLSKFSKGNEVMDRHLYIDDRYYYVRKHEHKHEHEYIVGTTIRNWT